MVKRNDKKFVGIWMPSNLLKEIDDLATQKMSNQSQIIREATLKGLKLL